MIQQIHTTALYKQILQAEADGYRIIKLQGGSRSSKTWSIFHFFIIKALQGERFDVTITREFLQLAKDTLLRDLAEMTQMYNLPVTPDFNINRQNQIYNLFNGEFLFWGLDKPKKAHGKKQKYAWMNEVIETGYKYVFDQLEMRTEKLLILDYNPSDEDHWVFELDKRDDVITILSSQLDNPFLPPQIRRKIEGYEPTPHNIEQGTADAYMWDVYGLGVKAKLKGVIFSKWDVVDSVPANAKSLGYGLDFGFNHPAAVTEVFIYDQELYFDEIIYEDKLVNFAIEPNERTLAKLMTDRGVGTKEIIADSAEPKSIKELRNAGFNIKGAAKGTDSVRFGIDLLKKYKKHITRRSVNVRNEHSKYKWATDRNGEPLSPDTPVKEFDHAIDGIRYLVTKKLGNKQEVKTYPGLF